jgi:hypothetical protein
MRTFSEEDLAALPQSRAAAVEAGSTLFFNGKSCPKGHLSARRTSTGGCELCLQANTLRQTARRKEQRRKEVAAMVLVCKACGSEFKPNFGKGQRSHTAIFCSDDCRKATDDASKRNWLENNPKKRKEVANAYARKMTLEKGEAWENSRQRNDNYKAQRLAEDPQFRLAHNCRTRINIALRSQLTSKRWRSPELLGCTVTQLMEHIEKQFQPGMTWDNWSRDGWHLDHIRPLSSFDLTDPDQQKRAFHHSNLQPLWASENLSKGDSWEKWEES